MNVPVRRILWIDHVAQLGMFLAMIGLALTGVLLLAQWEVTVGGAPLSLETSGVAIFALLLVGGLTLAEHRVRQVRRLTDAGAAGEAVVDGVQGVFFDHSGLSQRIHYHYTVGGGTYYGHAYTYPSVARAFKAGERARMHYDPAHPRYAVLDRLYRDNS